MFRPNWPSQGSTLRSVRKSWRANICYAVIVVSDLFKLLQLLRCIVWFMPLVSLQFFLRQLSSLYVHCLVAVMVVVGVLQISRAFCDDLTTLHHPELSISKCGTSNRYHKYQIYLVVQHPATHKTFYLNHCPLKLTSSHRVTGRYCHGAYSWLLLTSLY
jgi:hypothetical protein